MLNKNKVLVKGVKIDFNDLIMLKEKIDKSEDKCKNALDSMLDTNHTTYLLNKRDSAIYTFIVAAKIYYNSDQSDFESLKAKYEEEKQYKDSLEINKEALILSSSLGQYSYKNSLKNTYPDDLDYADEDEELENIDIMKIN